MNRIAKSLAAIFAIAATAGTAHAAPDTDVWETIDHGTDWAGIHKSESDFGVDVDFEASVQASANLTDGDYYTRAYATGLAEAELFGQDLELGYINAYGTAYAFGSAAGYDVRILGITVASESVSSEFSVPLGSLTIAGAGGSAKFSLAGISVKAEAEAGGTLELTLNGSIGTSEASAGLEPTFTVGAAVDASISVATFKCGVEGDITLLAVGVPATATLEHTGSGNFTMTFDVSYWWEVLSGKLKLYVKEKLTGIKTSTTIFNFGGWSDEGTIWKTSSSFSI